MHHPLRVVVSVLVAAVRVLAMLVVVALAPGARADGPVTRANPRLMCGCASSRFLARGPIALDASSSIGVWLHGDGQLQTFAADAARPGRVVRVEAPVRIDEAPFTADGTGAAASVTTSRLLRVRATAPIGTPALLGIVRPGDGAPRDVIAVTAVAPHDDAHASPPPTLRAAWLAPLETRQRRACGTFATQRLAFELQPGSMPPEAFVVTDRTHHTSALIDARHVGAFGIGRVDVCEQGLALVAQEPSVVEVRPVSADFVVGDAWVFASDGTGVADPTRVEVPASADAARAAEPFPVPGEGELRGAALKNVGVVVMAGVVGVAVLLALLLWVIIPAARRRIEEVRCPACEALIPVDVLDRKTDGFFCPSCGSAGIWKGRRIVVDVRKL